MKKSLLLRQMLRGCFSFTFQRTGDFNKMVFDAINAAGYKAILLTVDALVSGYREANLRTNFAFPVPLDFFTRFQGAKGEGQTVAQMYASSAREHWSG